VFAAGNDGEANPSFPDEGYGTVMAEGTAKNVITVGAAEGVRASGTDGCGVSNAGADSARDIIDFSSRGPTDDGRLKPALVAPGTHITGAAPQHAGYTGIGVCNQTFGGNAFYSLVSGTSQAAPEVTGVAALIRDWYRRTRGAYPSPALTKALMVNTARDLAGGDDGAGGSNGDAPTQIQGWGRVDLGSVLSTTTRTYVDQTSLFGASGSSSNRVLRSPSTTEPLRVTLVWTDPPGAAQEANNESPPPALVNDLNLTVAHDGVTYAGNAFAKGASTTGGEPDKLNNVENVWLPKTGGGLAEITVTAANLPGDGVPSKGDTTDQDYALVVSNGRVVPATPPVQVTPPVVKPAALGLAKFGKKGRFTVLKKLSVANVPAGATVTLTCKGKGCPKKGYKRTFKTVAKNLDLTRVLRKAKLRKGAKITLRLAAPGAAPRISTWKVGSKPGKVAAKLG